MDELIPFLLGLVAVVLLVALYVFLVSFVLTSLLWPSLPVLLLGGVVAGLVLAVAAVGATLVGIRTPVVVGPAHVRHERWFRPTRSPFPRDDAWPHYLVGQVRADGLAAARGVRDAVRGPWRWAGRHVRATPAVLVAWPLLLFPVVAGGAASVAAGAGLLGLLAVLGAAWAVAVTGWAAVAVLLRTGDRLLRVSRRARASCGRAGCNHVTDLPAFRCPCSRLHRDLRPGVLGVVFRRCACDRLLPTTVLRAASALPASCPLCDGLLPRGSGALTDVRIPVLGPVSSGKSRFVAAAMLALERHVRAADGEFAAADDASGRTLAAGADLVTAAAPTVKTAAQRPPAAISARLGVPATDGFLHVFDPAGELLRDREQSRGLPFLDEAQGFVLIVDPFSVPAVRAELGPAYAERLAQACPATDDPEASYQVTAQWLRDAGAPLHRRALAVVLVKADLLVDLPPGRALREGVPEVRSWLLAHDLDHLVTAAERDFGEVRCFLVSSLTGWRHDDPHTALTPLVWLAGLAGLRLPEPVGVAP